MKKWFISAFLMMMAVTARADLVVEVTQGVDAPTPIAVVPFQATGLALNEDIAQIVSDDLGRSGFFKPYLRHAVYWGAGVF